MRHLALALLLTLIPSGCATVKTVWPSTVKCTTQLAGSLVQQVEGILLTGSGPSISDDAATQLEKLAIDNGTELVSCVVQQLVSQWTQQPAVRSMREIGPVSPSNDAAARGHDFLKRHGVTVVAGPPA